MHLLQPYDIAALVGISKILIFDPGRISPLEHYCVLASLSDALPGVDDLTG
jgi:hypothetical protein